MGAINDAARAPVPLADGSWQFVAQVNHWRDGDTVDLDCLIDVGFEEMVTKRRHIRLLGCNAPELHSTDLAEKAAGQAALDYISQIAPVGSLVTVVVVKFDKYGGRDDGFVIAPAGDLSGLLISSGHAVPYNGGPR